MTRRPARDRAGRLGVDAKRQLAFVLGAIDRGVGCGIDDQIGRKAIERGGNVFRPRKIEPARSAQRRVSRAHQAAHSAPPDLAGGAGQQNPHQICP